MFAYKLADAALLARASYDPKGIVEPAVADTLDHNDVQAVLLANGTLVLPGSNSLNDYLKFNLRIFNVGRKQFRFDEGPTEKGASQTWWHQGFLSYSRIVYDWIGHRKPKFIIGHSLGAAATQILSKSWAVPAIGFAAPRPKKSANRVLGDDKCLSICRTDDLVTGLPTGFNHMGRAILISAQSNGIFPHAMPHYVSLLEKAKDVAGVPKRWPR